MSTPNILITGSINGWEIGKTYRLADPSYGLATILGIIHNSDKDGISQIIGVTVDPDTSKTDPATWTAEGLFHIYSGENSGFDLTKSEVAL